MTSSIAAPTSARLENPPMPDHAVDPGNQFAVEWQVVERVPRYPDPQPVESWEFS